MAGKKVRIKSEEAVIEIPTHELIDILQSSAKKLEYLLGTKDPRFDDRLKIILGAMDRNDTPKVWPLMGKDGRIPVTIDPREEEIQSLRKQVTLGGTAGNASIKIEPAADSILEIHWITMSTDHVGGIPAGARLFTAGGTDLYAYLCYKVDLAAASGLVYPPLSTGSDNFGYKGTCILNDAFELYMLITGLTGTDKADFILLYNVRGDDPTFTYTQPAAASWADVS